jgi:hypothetical protein
MIDVSLFFSHSHSPELRINSSSFYPQLEPKLIHTLACRDGGWYREIRVVKDTWILGGRKGGNDRES